MQWKIYLSGEIHTDWREQIIDGAKQQQLPVSFTSPVTDHGASDAAGDVLGKPQDDYWRDHQSASVNAIRTQTHIRQCDLAIIRFGSEYKQWNAAFDAGMASALGKPTIIMHQSEHAHALKEVDAAALAVTTSSEQVVEILRYVIEGKLAGYGDE